jgi:hypothetical protein
MAAEREESSMTIRLRDVNAGDVLVADNGFTCIHQGLYEVKEDSGRLYVDCRDGKHFLDGQDDGDGILIGFTRGVGAA